MNVLSLFDGMSCGRIALERARIKVDNYYSSEIDKYAISVADKNYPQDAKNRLGDITKITEEILADIPNIDLVIGGSPCQSFSFAGKRNGMTTKENIEILSLNHYLKLKEEGFGFQGQSYLFWEYVRVLKEVKPKFFLLENVKMSKKWENVITKELGVSPIMIDSNLVSAQNRKRLYWANISKVGQIKDKKIFVKDILDYSTPHKGLSEKAIEKHHRYIKNYIPKGKAPTITTEVAHGTGKNITPKCHMEIKAITGEDRVFSPIECERLQTVPDNYTSGVSDTQRYKMLGNGWTVDIVAHILKGLKGVR